MVEGGQLRLAPGCRAALPGFYDPAPEEDKALYVLYQFRVRAVTSPGLVTSPDPVMSH